MATDTGAPATRDIAPLAGAMLRLVSEGADLEADALSHRLDQLQNLTETAGAQGDIDALLQHGRLIAARMPELDHRWCSCLPPRLPRTPEPCSQPISTPINRRRPGWPGRGGCCMPVRSDCWSGWLGWSGACKSGAFRETGGRHSGPFHRTATGATGQGMTTALADIAGKSVPLRLQRTWPGGRRKAPAG